MNKVDAYRREPSCGPSVAAEHIRDKILSKLRRLRDEWEEWTYEPIISLIDGNYKSGLYSMNRDRVRALDSLINEIETMRLIDRLTASGQARA
jgi:hypothetical protein